MAEIVVMKTWRDRNAGRLAARGTVSAQPAVPAKLVMFTGVRYERLEDMTHRTMDEMTLRLDKH